MVGFPCFPGEHATGGCVKLNVISKTRTGGLSLPLCHTSSFRARILETAPLSPQSSGQMALEVPQGTGPRADGVEGLVPCLSPRPHDCGGLVRVC